MGALENFLKAPSSGRSREGEKYKASEKTLFYGIKIDAIVRFGFWRRHQNWCHSDENLFCFSFLAPKRSQLPVPSRIWRQNGAYFSQNLLPHPYRILRASKTTLILRFLENIFGASCLLVSGACICLASPFPYSNMEGKKTTSYFSLFENLSLLLYRNIQNQKVNTTSKQFPLLLNSHMRGLENDIELRFFEKSLYSLTATSEAKKRHRIMKVLRKLTN